MINLNNRDLLARTLEAEAGDQGSGGMLAAGSVIMNRLKNPAYGSELHSVILQPGQFSAWNSYTGYEGGLGGLNMYQITPSSTAFEVADQLLAGSYEDPTGGAMHYYNPEKSNPSWGQRSGGTWQKIGDHIFGFPGNKDPNRSENMITDENVNNQPLNAIPFLGNVNTDQVNAANNPPRRGLFDFLGKAVGGTFSGLKGALSGDDPDKSDKLAIALMSLSGNPTQLKPLMQMAANDIQERKDLRLRDKGKNQTIEFLTKRANEGDTLAASALRLVEPAGPAEALSTYINATSTNAANKTGATTKAYDNGTTLSIFQDGTRVVTSPSGETLTGAAAEEAIRVAQADEVEQARITEFKTTSAESKAKMVQTTIDSIINVNSSLRNYAKAKDALRRAIANGQNISGFVSQYFPNVSVEAAELEYARNSLGLDVVGSVTFGALSKGELDLALTQGLPTSLNEPQLLEFIERREVALGKYRTSLLNAARIMANPQKNYDDYLDTLENLEVKPNPYKETPHEELMRLVAEVQSGNSTLPPETRQQILDEARERAGL